VSVDSDWVGYHAACCFGVLAI